MWLVTSTIEDPDYIEMQDNWCVCETYEEAMGMYEALLGQKGTYSANVSQIVHSTEPHHEESFEKSDFIDYKYLLL